MRWFGSSFGRGCGFGLCCDTLEISLSRNFELAEKDRQTGWWWLLTGSLDVWALNNSRAKKRIAAWLYKNETTSPGFY
jgi:hypothetical protein